MFVNHTLRIATLAVLGFALWACGDNKAAAIDAPGSPADAAPSIDARPDAPPDAFVPLNLVANPGIEAGATGWTTNGGAAVVAASAALAHGGTSSLLTNARSGSWNGPAVDLTALVVPGKMYSATVFAQLVAPGTETFNLSVRHTCSEDGQHFNQMNTRTAADAVDNAWVAPTSTFTVINAPGTCTLTNFIVYVETTTAAVDFYIDDISVTEVIP